MISRESYALHTFVVPAYKQSDYLEPCVLSLLRQSSPSRIIITTSTPNRHIRSIAEKFNLPLYINPEQKGLAADWSFGFKAADTPYVTLAHQDDIYCPGYTENFLTAARNNPGFLIAFSDYLEMDESHLKRINLLLIIKKILLIPFLFNGTVSSKMLKKMVVSLGSPICCPSVMYNKERLDTFSFDTTFDINPDWDAWLRLSADRGSFVYVNQRLTAHRIHSKAETTLGLMANTRQCEDRRLFERLYPRPLSDLMLALYSCSYRFNGGILSVKYQIS